MHNFLAKVFGGKNRIIFKLLNIWIKKIPVIVSLHENVTISFQGWQSLSYNFKLQANNQNLFVWTLKIWFYLEQDFVNSSEEIKPSFGLFIHLPYMIQKKDFQNDVKIFIFWKDFMKAA